MKVYLVRHGKTEWNRDRKFQGHNNSPLLEEGKDQARRLGAELKHKAIGACYCSPLQRTRETAELLDLGRPLIHEEAFKEIHLGLLEGQKFTSPDPDLKKLIEQFWNSPHLFDKSLTGGEDFLDIQNRSINRLEELVRINSEDFLIVSHGALIKSILNFYLEKPLWEFWEPPLLKPASLTILEFREGQFKRIDKLNDTSHYSC